MTLGPASALLEQELSREIQRQGIVVWLDRDASFTGFVERLRERHAQGLFPYPVVGFRGSYLEMIFALEPHGDGYDRAPLLVHMPGFNQTSIRTTPVLELYLAGKCHQKSLETLIQQAATGRATPAEVANLLATKPTLEQADAWLDQASDHPSMGLAAVLESSGQVLLVEALTSADGGNLSRQVKGAPDEEVVKDYLHKLLGMDGEWLQSMRAKAPEASGAADAPSDQTAVKKPEGPKPILDAAGAWLLCVEYVHDLQRPPHLDALKRLAGLPTALVKVCQRLVGELRTRYPDAYERIAGHVEGSIQGELDQMTAEDLGQIDTFREEEDRVLAGAVAALAGKEWGKAETWYKAREGERSFWTKRDQSRRLAWDLVGEAAAFGLALAQNPRPFAEVSSHERAAHRYAEVASKVDRAHRRFEQERARRLDPRVPHFGALQEVVGLLRELHRSWADQLAKDFGRLCRSCGFLPESELRQRNVYEQVVQPLTLGGQRVAVFLIDAFRYEMAAELFEELRGSGGPGTSIDLKARLAELPTITSVGMNALAPVAKDEKLSVAGELEGFRAGEFTVKDPKGRSRAMGMRSDGQPALHLELADLCDRPQEVLGKLKSQRVVVVHSEELDSAGEANLGVDAFEAILRRLRAAWHHLQNKGIKQAVFTADHGFLLQDSTTKIVPFGKKTDPNRRYVIDRYERGEEGLTPVPFASLGYEGIEGYLLLRDDTAAFATPHASRAFDHGGNSPQERYIPVLIVSRKAPEGVFVAEYLIEAKAEDDAFGCHRISLRLVFPQNSKNALPFVGPRAVDLALRVPGRPDVRIVVKEVSGDGKLAAGRIQAGVKGWLEVFFALEGKADERVQVEVYHPDSIHRVQGALADGMFAVVGTTTAPAASAGRGWTASVEDAGARAVFEHLADHGSITEEEVIRKLGSPRAARRFALSFDSYLRLLPFKVRSESNASGLRYVREEES